MKKTYRLIGVVLLGVAVTTATGVILQMRKKKSSERLSQTADEGYETAHDINFPRDNSFGKKSDLKYGPVI